MRSVPAILKHRWAVGGDLRPRLTRQVRKMGAHQIVQFNSLPFVPYQQILVEREGPDALVEACDKGFGCTGRRLTCDCLHQAERVFSAITGLAHQEMNVLNIGP